MKVGVIGTGFVGATAAFSMVMDGAVEELVLIDINKDLASAQAQDISHARPFAYPVQVRAGEYTDLDGADIVVLACGVNQKEGETRLQLLDRNAKIFSKVTEQVLAVVPNPIFVVASNPVDVMTHFVTEHTGLPKERVIGSGTILDTARFRELLGQHLGISPQSVHAYVLGEHGDSEVLYWSGAMAGNVNVETFAQHIGKPLTPEIKQQIDDGVRRAAYKIISGKQATYYGIAAGLARLVRCIANDERTVMTCSIIEDRIGSVERVALSLPRVVGQGGIITSLQPVLTDEEQGLLEKSASVLKEAANSIQLQAV